MTKWEYGGVYHKYEMGGEIKIGTGIVKVHDIFDEIPEFMLEADCIFVDPPCSRGNLKSFYTKADKDECFEYKSFLDRLFDCIDKINPDNLFVETFKSNHDDVLKELKSRYPCVKVYNSMYYNKKANVCWVIHGSNKEHALPIDNLDEAKMIAWICANFDYKCIGDPCMGRGLVGINAYKNGNKFVGTELNKKRLAVLVDKIKTS